MVTVSYKLIPYRCLDRTVVTVLVVNPKLAGENQSFCRRYSFVAFKYSNIDIILESIEADLITLRN